jgi:hypothetical protein
LWSVEYAYFIHGDSITYLDKKSIQTDIPCCKLSLSTISRFVGDIGRFGVYWSENKLFDSNKSKVTQLISQLDIDRYIFVIISIDSC